MLWMLCTWLVALFSTFARGHNTLDTGYTLSPSGYHVCPGIEIVPMTTVFSNKSAYTQMTPCGGWLPWKMCNVTRYSTVYQTQVINTEEQVMKCCEGYEQVGSYCALARVQSSRLNLEFVLYILSRARVHGVTGTRTVPAGRNAADQKPSRSVWSLRHTVTGALSPLQFSVYHTHSWSTGWFSTSSCLLLGSSQLLSLTYISDTLLLLLENIEEVMAVDVRDVDECATPVLRDCSPLAYCSNTLGSYNCTCAAGSADLQPSRPGTQCISIPKIANLWAKHVTSSSFNLLWDVPSQINFTSNLVLFHGTHQLGTWITTFSNWTWTDLQPGVLYTAQVALCMCGYCGNATEVKVKTDAQTLEAVVRISNINFTEALLNPDSEEYKMFTEKVKNETLHSLPLWILDLVLSGKVLVLITNLSPGSIIVTFNLVFLPNSTQDIYSIANNIMESLQNSTQFYIDPNYTKITDVKECALGEVDCSPWADCEDTFGSYTCMCHYGYTDANPERPGRTCQANDMTTSTSSPNTTSPSSTSTNSTQGTNITVSSSTAEPSVNQTTELTTSPSTPSSSTPPSYTSITQTTETTDLSSTSHSSTPLISHSESITVECGPGFMVISVSRFFLELKHISVSSLYLGIPSCNLTEGNVTHVRLFVAWGTCGTQLRNNSQNSTVQVTLYNADARLQVPVICTYINSFVISTGYSSSGYDMINNVVEGSVMYQVTVRLLNGTYPLPQNYTLSPEDKVIIEVGLSSNMSQIKVVINKCWANPSNDPAEQPNNIFLENSCPVPNKYTTVLENGESTHSLLAVNLFQLVNFDVIYLHCQIQICIEMSTATCRPECNMVPRLARTSRGANVIGMAKASYGPLLKSHLEVTLQDAVWNMRTLGFILLALGVCVLALGAVAVAMFCRRRMGNYNFQFKPREENFTYHVFDT
ncbi:hypothetical protein PDJAM_G00078940 [Pangasius djambal]|uniref:Uncharacterized protein n=1 Tax=Pangasius djambal TaxID=1691987 RepID=A0ACC5Z2E4_9TELE|nr:hypothetical protein [Pangasius djambal]